MLSQVPPWKESGGTSAARQILKDHQAILQRESYGSVADDSSVLIDRRTLENFKNREPWRPRSDEHVMFPWCMVTLDPNSSGRIGSSETALAAIVYRQGQYYVRFSILGVMRLSGFEPNLYFFFGFDVDLDRRFGCARMCVGYGSAAVCRSVLEAFVDHARIARYSVHLLCRAQLGARVWFYRRFRVATFSHVRCHRSALGQRLWLVHRSRTKNPLRSYAGDAVT